jgi:23S rRNA (adenine2030-N6)-methyltransferase
MLSYRHGFHAGDDADVSKHVVLVQLLKHLTRKDAALVEALGQHGTAAFELEFRQT